MKQFNLEAALAGAPVKLRDGRKAYVERDEGDDLTYPLEGYADVPVRRNCSWTKGGSYHIEQQCGADIIGMWDEQETVPDEAKSRLTFTGDTALRIERYGVYSVIDLEIHDSRPYACVGVAKLFTDTQVEQLQLRAFRGEVFTDNTKALECAISMQKWLDENFKEQKNEIV